MSDEEERLRKMIRELQDVDDDLNCWETDFLDSMDDWHRPFTEKQAVTIERIWDKVLGPAAAPRGH